MDSRMYFCIRCPTDFSAFIFDLLQSFLSTATKREAFKPCQIMSLICANPRVTLSFRRASKVFIRPYEIFNTSLQLLLLMSFVLLHTHHYSPLYTLCSHTPWESHGSPPKSCMYQAFSSFRVSALAVSPTYPLLTISSPSSLCSNAFYHLVPCHLIQILNVLWFFQ